MRSVDMHRLQELVRLHRMGTGAREVARLLKMSPNTDNTVVPDNLRAAVIRAVFGVADEAVLNRSYRELARHYGFKIDPTPPYSPEKKGKVESGVKYVKNNFFRPRADEKSVDVLRSELARWVREIAGMRKHGTTRKRPLKLFDQVERAAMQPLPSAPWQPVLWRTPTLRNDCQVIVEQARYSAPWRLIGKTLLARVTSHSVELYFEDARVALHERQRPGGHNIVSDHLPSQRSDHRHRSRSYWEDRAAQLGGEVLDFVREVFDSDDVLHQLRKVQAIVRHLETFPPERARAACRRASFYGSLDFLAKALDVPTSADLERPRFARTIQEELLHFTTEDVEPRPERMAAALQGRAAGKRRDGPPPPPRPRDRGARRLVVSQPAARQCQGPRSLTRTTERAHLMWITSAELDADSPRPAPLGFWRSDPRDHFCRTGRDHIRRSLTPVRRRSPSASNCRCFSRRIRSTAFDHIAATWNLSKTILAAPLGTLSRTAAM
jgi:hypothetical protein